MGKTGLSYYQADTDRFQDIRIKRLKKRYGCEGYAIFQYIQNEIHRVEGCFIRFTDDQIFDVAEYWVIEEQRVEEIVNYCAEIELFDAITWHTKQILTSIEIQQRYVEICRRAKKKMLIPDDISLLKEKPAEAIQQPQEMPLFAAEKVATKVSETVYQSPQLYSIPQNSAEFCGNPRKPAENCNKEKKRKINPPSIPPQREEEVIRRSLAATPFGQAMAAAAADDGRRQQPPAEEVKRNPNGLIEAISPYNLSPKEVEEVLQLSGFGTIGNPVWKILGEMRGNNRIRMPRLFLLARLRDAMGMVIDTGNKRTHTA